MTRRVFPNYSILQEQWISTIWIMLLLMLCLFMIIPMIWILWIKIRYFIVTIVDNNHQVYHHQAKIRKSSSQSTTTTIRRTREQQQKQQQQKQQQQQDKQDKVIGTKTDHALVARDQKTRMHQRQQQQQPRVLYSAIHIKKKTSTLSRNDTLRSCSSSSSTSLSMMRIVGILVTTMCLGILFLLLLLLMLWWSPYNVDSARTVFVIPLFTTLECHALKKQLDTIIAQSIQQEQQQQEDVVTTSTTTTNKAWQHAANNKNMNATTQTLLEFPLGWPHKLQLQSIPTTTTTTTGWNNSKNKMTISYFHWNEFMNHLPQTAQTTSSNVDDNDDDNHNKNNNNKNDNDLEQLLNARLAPTLELLYGIPAKYWRLVRNNNEILVRMVRYDVSPLPQVNNTTTTTRTRIRTTSQPQSLSSSQQEQQEQQDLPLWQEEDEEGNNELQNFASPFVDVIATLESTVNLIQFRIILTPTAATTTRTTNHPVGSDASAAPSTEEKDGTITVIDKTTTTTTSSNSNNKTLLLLSTKTTRTQYWNRWTRQPLEFDEMTTTMTNVVDIPSPPALAVGSLVVHSTQVPHKEQVIVVTMHNSTNECDATITTTTRSPKQQEEQEGQQEEQEEEPRIELVGYVTWQLPRNWRRNSHILNTTTSHNNNDDNNNNDNNNNNNTNNMMISSFLVSWLGSIIPSCWYATWFSVNWWTHVLQQQSIVSSSWSLQQQPKQRKSGVATTTHRHGRRYYSNLENDDQDKRLREIFAFLSRAVQTLGDALLPHRIRTLVPHHYHYRYHHHQHANNAYLMEFDQTMALEQQQQQTRQQQSLSLFDKWDSWDDEQKQKQQQRDSMTTCLSRGGEENHYNQDYCYYNEPHDGSSSSLSSLPPPPQQEEEQQEQQQRCMADPYDPVAWKPGDLNQMFERIVATYNETVHVWSRPSDNSHGRCGNIAVDKNKNNNNKEAATTTTRDGPWIITIDDFITNTEAKQFIQWGYTNGFERSQGVVATSKQEEVEEAGSAGGSSSTSSGVVSADRTSSNTWCHEGCQDDAIIVAVQKRLEEMTQIPMEHAEAIQLLQCKCFLYCVLCCCCCVCMCVCL